MSKAHWFFGPLKFLFYYYFFLQMLKGIVKLAFLFTLSNVDRLVTVAQSLGAMLIPPTNLTADQITLFCRRLTNFQSGFR